MTRNEFVIEAMLRVGAALVKVYDEKAEGITDNDAAQQDLADNAWSIATRMADTAFDESEGAIFKEKNLMKWHPISEKPKTGMYVLYEVWGHHPYCITASYDEEKDEWRQWDDIQVVGAPLNETQLIHITHWMPIQDPELICE